MRSGERITDSLLLVVALTTRACTALLQLTRITQSQRLTKLAVALFHVSRIDVGKIRGTSHSESPEYITRCTLNANGIFAISGAANISPTVWRDGVWWSNDGFCQVGGSYSSGACCGAFCTTYAGVSSASGAAASSLSCKSS